MKPRPISFFLGITLLALFASHAQAAPCSLNGAAGKYGFTLTGVVITQAGAIPIAAVGGANLDASGNATGVESRSVGGGFADETFTGSYTVNPDCTGTLTLQIVQFGVTVHSYFVIDDSGREFLAIETEKDFIITRIARRQFPVGDWRQ